MTKKAALKIQAICTLISIIALGGTVWWFMSGGSYPEEKTRTMVKSAVDHVVAKAEKLERVDILTEKGMEKGMFSGMDFGNWDSKEDDLEKKTLIPEEKIAIPVEDIKNLEFNWPLGIVEIQIGKGPDILLQESARRVLEQKNKMVWIKEGGRLRVDAFAEAALKTNRTERRPAKRLVIEVPEALAKTWEKLEGSTASGEVQLWGMTAKRININTASGDIHLEDVAGDSVTLQTACGDLELGNLKADTLSVSCASGDLESRGATVKTLKASMASGDIQWNGEVGAMDVASASGDIEMHLQKERPHQCKIQTASGNITLILPGKEPLKISKTKMKGEFSSNIPTVQEKNAPYTLETFSGDIEIQGGKEQ